MSTPTPVVQAYLNFDGRCEEAIEFYRTALGAEVDMLMRVKDNPEPDASGCGGGPKPPEDKIMHCSFRIGGSTVMASDCYCSGKPEFKGFSLSITVNNEADAERIFKALSDGGQVQMPLEKTFWSPKFGVVSDRFGVNWMVNMM